MSNSFDQFSISLERIRTELREGSVNSIRKALPDQAILEACREAGYTFRRRLLDPVVVVLHMILTALWPEESFQASWRILWASLRSRIPELSKRGPGSATLSRARARQPHQMWRHLFVWVSQQAQELSARWARWRSHRVVLIDGTCLSMADEADLRRAFGSCSSKGKEGRYPLARLVTVALANTMTVIDYALGRYDEPETALMWTVLKSLKPGDLLVGDCYFAAAHCYEHYRRLGLEFVTRKNGALKLSSLRRLWTIGRGDFVASMRVNPVYRRRDPSLPASVLVRIIGVTARVRGRRETIWLVTSLLDGEAYPAEETALLYLGRWRIETLFRQLKVDASADVLRSLRPEGIRKEVAARIMALNLVRILMMEAAEAHGVDPVRLSLAETIRAVLAFAAQMAVVTPERLQAVYRAMLYEISLHVLPERPGRNEPRMIRREKKHYPALRMTRQQWRNSNAA